AVAVGEVAAAGASGGAATGVAVGVGIAKMLRFSAKVSRFQNAAVTTHAKRRMTKILIRDLVLRFEVISITTCENPLVPVLVSCISCVSWFQLLLHPRNHTESHEKNKPRNTRNTRKNNHETRIQKTNFI